MSVSYRVVRRDPRNQNCKVLDQGVADSRRSILDNPPRIIVRSAKPATANIYEVQIWCETGWVCLAILMPWTAVQTQVSLNACLTADQIPLVGEDAPTFTWHDVPLSSADLDLPRSIAPAVTYI